MRPEIFIHLSLNRRRETRPVWRGGLRIIGWFEALAAFAALALLVGAGFRLLGG